MAKPISIQLYSVREAMEQDVWGTIGKIGEIGYPGIEPCNVPGGDVAEAAKKISDLGLTVSALQTGTPVGENKEKLMDEAEALSCSHIVCPYYGAENFADMDAVKKTAELFNEAIANCAERGMTFGYHNHEFELESIIDGKPALLQLAALAPQLFFTVDTYWVTVGGQNASEVVKEMGTQANILHIKDGPLVKSEPMVAAGSGKMDFPPIVAAADSAKWLVVELDRCASDMMAAVEQSFKYLIDSGLGCGK